jgi:HEAT repeat protein
MRRFVAIFPAALISGALAIMAGCSSGPDIPEELSHEKTYLDDKAMEAFNADLMMLSASVDRGEEDSVKALRGKISESARVYQRALVSALYDDTSTPRRAMAAVLLGFTGDAAVIGELIKIVADTDEAESVRMNAVLGLTELDDKLRDYKDHKALMLVLGNTMVDVTSNASLRRACVYAYATAFDPRHGDSAQPVRGRFTNDPSPDVQIAAIYSLGDPMNDKGAVPLLATIGVRHPDPEIRAATAIALGRIDDPEKCIPALVAACQDEDAMTRREAMDAISRHHMHR